MLQPHVLKLLEKLSKKNKPAENQEHLKTNQSRKEPTESLQNRDKTHSGTRNGAEREKPDNQYQIKRSR